MMPVCRITVCLLVLVGTFQASKSECDRAQGILKSQQLCKHINEAILEAKSNHYKKALCNQVKLMLKCTATNVTSCFDMFMEINEVYFHSPFDCKLPTDLILELQRKVLGETTSGGGGDTNNDDNKKPSDTPKPLEVTPKSSSSSSSSSSSTSSSEGQGSQASSSPPKEATPGYTVDGDAGTTRAPGVDKGGKPVKTGSQKQTGNSASLPRSRDVMTSLLVVIALVMAFGS